ncbi:uncharacterized protein L201_005001 [Kwoniella dendrophila CBS 6074]|uniref:Uncharacterized protein n=1 Tax=Kwoniella dendrophila CBS 6074 TaxID=1295534 RepID=A0AAX4JYW6_9TREE
MPHPGAASSEDVLSRMVRATISENQSSNGIPMPHRMFNLHDTKIYVAEDGTYLTLDTKCSDGPCGFVNSACTVPDKTNRLIDSYSQHKFSKDFLKDSRAHLIDFATNNPPPKDQLFLANSLLYVTKQGLSNIDYPRKTNSCMVRGDKHVVSLLNPGQANKILKASRENRTLTNEEASMLMKSTFTPLRARKMVYKATDLTNSNINVPTINGVKPKYMITMGWHEIDEPRWSHYLRAKQGHLPIEDTPGFYTQMASRQSASPFPELPGLVSPSVTSVNTPAEFSEVATPRDSDFADPIVGEEDASFEEW